MSVSPTNSTIVRLLASALCVAGTAACDPITDVRSDVYLMSGRRRRAVFGDGKR